MRDPSGDGAGWTPGNMKVEPEPSALARNTPLWPALSSVPKKYSAHPADENAGSRLAEKSPGACSSARWAPDMSMIFS